jgi:hypothetical protein
LRKVSSFNEKLSATDRFQLPMRSSDSNTISDIPKNTSSIYYNNDIINGIGNQVAPLPINIQKLMKDTNNLTFKK